MLTIDFETCSECDLGEAGPWRYAEHASTRILCMAYAFGNDPVQLWEPSQELPASVVDHVMRGGPVEAHNAEFELALWPLLPNAPTLTVAQLHCSAAKAAAMGLPRSLGGACEALGVEQQKSKEGRALMLKLCKPARITKNQKDPWRYHTAENLEALYAYCLQDVEAERSLSHACRDLNAIELKVFRATLASNACGLQIDIESVAAIANAIATQEAEAVARLQELTAGAVQTVNQHANLKQWLCARGVRTESTDKAAVADLLKRNVPDDVREVLEIRQALGRSSTKKINAMLARTMKDGRARGNLMYHGAGPGRWTGVGIQPQNLPKDKPPKDLEGLLAAYRMGDLELISMLWGDPAALAPSCLRGLITAQPGKQLIAADYSAIEARVLAWLCDEQQILRAFRDGEDLYVSAAKRALGTEELPEWGRALGKVIILGLGYGMGKAKFYETCKAWGVPVDPDICDMAVESYRETYTKIKAFWYGTEDAAIAAVEQPGEAYPCGRITWKASETALYARLPSKRLIRYHAPELREDFTPWGKPCKRLSYMTVNGTTHQWERFESYGGLLTENVTQGCARDLMANAWLEAEKAGLPVVLSVHDELVCESMRHTHEDLEQIMCQLPAWATGLPIAAEGWAGRRYRK